jgi:hypothetical protein
VISFDIAVGPDPGSSRIVKTAAILIDAVVQINEIWISSHRDRSCMLVCDEILYDAANSVSLVKDIPIKTAAAIEATGKALCVGLVAFDVAARRLAGQDAYPVFRPQSKRGLFHIVTGVDINGRYLEFDPSRELSETGRYHSAHNAGICCRG